MGSCLLIEAVPSICLSYLCLALCVEATGSFTLQRYPWSLATGCPCGIMSHVPQSPVFPVNLCWDSETSLDVI